jgi:cysteine-rich repeat protein
MGRCGDTFVQAGETCDEGNANSDAGACTAVCQAASCGDGLVHAGVEQCDAGPNNGPNQACLASCMNNVCGDGDQGPGEACDDGANNGDDKQCHADCELDVCGDGLDGPNETCDDGNVLGLDGCSATCHAELMCGSKLYKCGNGLDDDGDGKIDLEDPECTTPCDEDEESFQTTLPGQNLDCKSDCYWDSDSGVGNDQCEWQLKCDMQNPGADIGCGFDPDLKMCAAKVPPQCLDVCVPLVPNGCDCFGCCLVGDQYVYLNSNPDCSLGNLAACNSCTFFPQCSNACEPEQCELCFGQDVDDLPPECGGMPTCEPGVTPCADTSECGPLEFCQTGCCVPIMPQ